MLNKIKNSTFLRNFKNNTDGTMVVTYAVSLMATMASIGVAYDTAYYFTGKEKAQHTADMIALAATTYVRDHGEPGLVEDCANDEDCASVEDFADGQVYYLDDYDLDITPYVSELLDEDGNKVHRTQFTVEYDTPEEGLLTTTVKATGQPKVMSIFNIDEFKFEATSVTSYLKEDLKDPASILFILDNSGSMRFDVDGNDEDDHGYDVTDTRIVALRETMTNFEEKMSALTSATPDVLRTGMYAFSSSNHWEAVEVEVVCDPVVVDTIETEVFSHYGDGDVIGTETVSLGFQDVPTGETETSEETVFIWSGDDAYSSSDHRAYKRANRSYSNRRYGYWGTVTTTVELTEWEEVFEEQNIYEQVGIYVTEYEDVWETPAGPCFEDQNTQITDSDAIVIATKTDMDWDMFSADLIPELDEYAGTYPSGALALANTKMGLETAAHQAIDPLAEPKKYVILMTDGQVYDQNDSEDSCTDLKDSGVEVYAVGFAIDETLKWNGEHKDEYAFLENCASPGKFVFAEDADALDEAFDQIGDDILEEVIRIQS